MYRASDGRGKDRLRVLSAIVCFGPCTRGTIEQKCHKHYAMQPTDVGDRLAELAECGVVDVADQHRLTGDPLWVAVERTNHLPGECDGKRGNGNGLDRRRL